MAYTRLHQNDRAADYYRQDIDAARGRGNKLVLAQALGNLATLRLDGGEDAEAIPLLEESRDLSQAIGYRRGEAIEMRNLGLAQLRTGNLAAAESSLQTAIAIQEALREPVGKDDLSTISLFDTQLDAYRFLQVALVMENRPEGALEISERGRAQALARLLTRRGQDPGPLPSPNVDGIRAVAERQNATLVEFSIEGSEIYIWVIHPNGRVVFRRSKIETHGSTVASVVAGLVQETRQSLGVPRRQAPLSNPGGSGPNDRLATFYQLLIAPIVDVLPSNPDQRVVLIPQDALFLLPFAALRDPDGHALIENHPLLVAPSIETLDMLAKRPSPAGNAAVVAGNPTMPSVRVLPFRQWVRLPPLPGAEREAIVVANLLGTTPLLGARATKEAVVNAMRTATTIHLAIHGLLEDVREEGMPGAVALGPSGDTDDGLLTTADITALQLKAKLVVLSACDTGEGKLSGDGVVGLARPFLAAGAEDVMVSLWSVPDQPTSDLMEAFYRALNDIPGKAQALRQAMLDTRARYPDPLAWAGFVVMGANK